MQMATTQLRIDPLTPAIGAEITGVDLSRPLDPQTLDAIYQALLDHLVLFFRRFLARDWDEVVVPHDDELEGQRLVTGRE